MRFPTYQSRGNINTQIAKTQSFNVNFKPLAQAAEGAAQKWQEATNLTETNQAYNNIEQGANNILQQASQDKDYKNEQKYLDELDNLRTSQEDTFSNKQLSLKFQRVADSTVNQASVKIKGAFRDKMIKHQQGEVIRSQGLNKQAYMNGDMSSVDNNKQILKENFNSGFITKSVYQKALSDMDNWEYEKVQQDTAENPQYVLDNIDNYNINEKQKYEIRKDAEKLIKKNNEIAVVERLQLEDLTSSELVNLVNSDATEQEKTKAIQSQVLLGNVSNEFANKIKGLMVSEKSINAVTKNADLADSILQLDVLNNNEDLSSEEYLRGLNKIRSNIIKLQEDGKLSIDDANIFYKEMNLQKTRKKEARSLKDISEGMSWGFQYNDAFDYFNDNMDTENAYGALRTYFNAVSLGDYTDDEKEAIAYKIRKEQSRKRLLNAIKESK